MFILGNQISGNTRLVVKIIAVIFYYILWMNCHMRITLYCIIKLATQDMVRLQLMKLM